MTTLAFDTATSFGAVCGLGSGERASAPRAADLLAVIDGLVPTASSIERIVVGRGPGSFTSIRIGLAAARALSFALGVPVAGASTLDGYGSAVAVIDARRGEVFTRARDVCKPTELDVEGKLLVGDGALRYRELFEAAGGLIPDEDDLRHRPDPVLLIENAGPFGDAGLVEPLYVREPDARPAG